MMSVFELVTNGEKTKESYVGHFIVGGGELAISLVEFDLLFRKTTLEEALEKKLQFYIYKEQNSKSILELAETEVPQDEVFVPRYTFQEQHCDDDKIVLTTAPDDKFIDIKRTYTMVHTHNNEQVKRSEFKMPSIHNSGIAKNLINKFFSVIQNYNNTAIEKIQLTTILQKSRFLPSSTVVATAEIKNHCIRLMTSTGFAPKQHTREEELEVQVCKKDNDEVIWSKEVSKDMSLGNITITFKLISSPNSVIFNQDTDLSFHSKNNEILNCLKSFFTSAFSQKKLDKSEFYRVSIPEKFYGEKITTTLGYSSYFNQPKFYYERKVLTAEKGS